jgi:hypothetical protein
MRVQKKGDKSKKDQNKGKQINGNDKEDKIQRVIITTSVDMHHVVLLATSKMTALKS